MDTLYKLISEYYGQSEIDDGVYGYTWFTDGHRLRLRPLHVDEGGWTFFIMF